MLRDPGKRKKKPQKKSALQAKGDKFVRGSRSRRQQQAFFAWISKKNGPVIRPAEKEYITD